MVSDDVDVAGLQVFDGSLQLDSTRVAVTPPDPEQGGLQVYQVAFKTALRLEDYSVRVEAEDWDRFLAERLNSGAKDLYAEWSRITDRYLLERVLSQVQPYNGQ